ncbi:hypothetical protein MLN81_18000 [Escherichia coli]|nr:hypothetical protein [Escherichia coli]
MLWKIISFLLVGICIFVFGLWLGSIQAEWAKPEHKDAVAYLAMIGGWVSGIATSVAVIISLYATYQASQNNIEKLSLTYEPYPSNDPDLFCANIKVKNLRPVAAHIQEFCLEISGLDGQININKLKAGGLPVKHALYQLGEVWEFAFYPHSTHSNLRFYVDIKLRGEPTFKKGFFVVKTTMKQYRLKMPKDLLDIMKESYEKQIKIPEVYKQYTGKEMEL